MIVETYNGEPLMFMVEDDSSTATTVLYEAVARAIEDNEKHIRVIAIGEKSERVIDILNVDDLLKKCFGFMSSSPLQYSLIDNGGYKPPVEELADYIRDISYNTED